MTIKSNVKQIELDGIGPVRMERSNRAKRTTITVRHGDGVRVAVPRGTSYREAEKFAREKAGWIKKYQNRIIQAERDCRPFLKNDVDLSRNNARQKLRRRVGLLAGEYGFDYNRVFIRNQKTRWGSCSEKNNVNLNVKLVLLPDELIDYVILHELVHTKIKDHSPAFWRELDRYVGDARQLDSTIKEFGLAVL
ncbi:MAG: SprT family zinc-dependent metalloprotease [Dehalococcoidia bacterium]